MRSPALDIVLGAHPQQQSYMMSENNDLAHPPELGNTSTIDVKMEEDLDVKISTGIKAEPDTVIEGEDAIVFEGEDEIESDEVNGVSGEVQANIVSQEILQGATNYTEYKWRESAKDKSLSEVQKVEIMEAAEKQGMQFIVHLRSRLVAVQKQLPEATRLIRAIDDLKKNKRECRITVGFLGMTGAGKSSFINALLGHNNLLPADARKACTAVCVEVGWNASDEPTKLFCAEVVCLTAAEWRQEIEALVKDIKDDEKGDDDGGRDLWRTERIKTAFQKLTCVYPHINTTNKLLNTSIEELLNDKDIKNTLQIGDKRLYLSSPTLEQFSTMVRPYIDSNNEKAEEGITFAFWPLVKVVKLYVKSPLLKDGICLVDLPGTHDTNAARGALAAKYQKELNIFCVMANARRAVSDKTAGDLLGDVQQRTMQLDNKFSSDRLCFILTMTDESIDVDDYISKSAKVRRELSKELKREKEGKASELAALKIRRDALAEKLDLQSQITQIKARRKDLYKAYAPLKPAYESILAKRKAGEESPAKPKQNHSLTLSAAQLAEAETLRGKFKSCTSQIQKLEDQKNAVDSKLCSILDKLAEITAFAVHCKSNKLEACIKHRNEESAKDIRKYYKDESKSIGRNTKGEPPLQVFGVSSKAFMELSAGGTVPGFASIDKTGILDVRTWLVAATLATRKINSGLMLESFLSLELSITPLLVDREVGYKMPETERNKIQGSFEKDLEEFQKKFDALSLATTKSCKSAVTKLTSKLSELEHDGEMGATGIVKRWPDKPMYWSTFRVICKHGGFWKRPYPLKEGDENHPYNWNEALAKLYLNKKMVRWWNTVIHKNLAVARSKYLAGVGRLTEEFVISIKEMVFKACPEIATEVDNWKESSLRTSIVIDKISADIFSTTIQNQASAIHPLVGQKIKAAWMPIYTECGQAKGKNHYRQSQLKHLSHIAIVKKSMYTAGSNAIRENFKALWAKLPKEFESGTSAVTKQIVEEFALMLDNHTLFGDTAIADWNHYNVKKKMQLESIQIFKDMKTAWGTAPVFEVEEKKHIPELPVPTLDDLYEVKKEEDDDEIDCLSD